MLCSVPPFARNSRVKITPKINWWCRLIYPTARPRPSGSILSLAALISTRRQCSVTCLTQPKQKSQNTWDLTPRINRWLSKLHSLSHLGSVGERSIHSLIALHRIEIGLESLGGANESGRILAIKTRTHTPNGARGKRRRHTRKIEPNILSRARHRHLGCSFRRK